MKLIKIIGMLAKAKHIDLSKYDSYHISAPLGGVWCEIQFGSAEVVGGIKKIYQKSDVVKFRQQTLVDKYCVTSYSLDTCHNNDLSEGWYFISDARTIEIKMLETEEPNSLQETEMKLVPKDFSRLYTIINKKKSEFDKVDAVILSPKKDRSEIELGRREKTYSALVYSNGVTHHVLVCFVRQEKPLIIDKYKILSFKGCTLEELTNWLRTPQGYEEVVHNIYL